MTRLIFLLACFGRRLLHGPARRPIGRPQKILIVQTAKLGDMVCATPLFRAIKQKYPDSKLAVMSNRINGDILAHNRDIDRFLVFSQDWKQMLRMIRQERFDAACLVTPNFKVLALLYVTGIPTIVAPYITHGVSAYVTRSYRMILSFVVAVPHRIGNYAPREYLRLLVPLGIRSEDTSKHLGFSNYAQKRVQALLDEGGVDAEHDFLVGITPSAGNTIKLWPPERFAEVANFLGHERRVVVIVLGSRDDKTIIETMLAGVTAPRVVNVGGLLNIDELKALISNLNLLVGVDTGPLYIAEAFGVPTIDIVGPMDEREQPPRGRRHVVVVPPFPRVPELHIMNAHSYDAVEARRQTESISAEMVIAAIRELMPKLQHA